MELCLYLWHWAESCGILHPRRKANSIGMNRALQVDMVDILELFRSSSGISLRISAGGR
jgi:hypothetical protein